MKNSFKIFSRKISRTILFTVIILNIWPAKDDPTVGLIYNDNTQSYSGSTLFAPNTSKFTYLIDNEGRLVHQWESEYVPGLSAYLLEDGHLLRSAAIESADPGVSITGGFQKNQLGWRRNMGILLWYATS